jgi:hypothetical protein
MVFREPRETPGMVIQIGLPPRRIDILTEVSGIEFDDAWRKRVTHSVGALEVPFPGREDLILNKRASARLKDLADLELLQRDNDQQRRVIG